MAAKGVINTEKISSVLRARSIDDKRRFLFSKFANSAQELDLTEPVNCEGYGRIRHFHRATNPLWPENPLPIDPAARHFGFSEIDGIRAQVFQNAACNWRCWYCYVPFALLAADESKSAWFTAEELVAKYKDEDERPWVLVLSGGQPDLIPEWIPASMRAIRKLGIERSTYLWSDDNLSNDYLWRYLTNDDLSLLRDFPGYGRVACFKGFDDASFAYNTGASPGHFDLQFELFTRLMRLGIDLYAYATFTGTEFSEGRMRRFVDRLQTISEALPLRTIPLEIVPYAVVNERLGGPIPSKAGEVQLAAIHAWNLELERRFSRAELETAIFDVKLEP